MRTDITLSRTRLNTKSRRIRRSRRTSCTNSSSRASCVSSCLRDWQSLLVRQLYDFLCRLAHAVDRREVHAAFTQQLLPLVDVGALHPDDDRHRHAELTDGGDDALGQHVASEDAAEDIDEDRLHVLVRDQNVERVANL